MDKLIAWINSRALCALGLLCLAGLTAHAETYYVAPAGKDENAGSQAAPFRQIRKALTRVHPGDTILVGDGDYLGFTAEELRGTAQAPITIRARGKNADILPTTDRSDNRDTIFLTHCAYIIVDGLRSRNARRAAVRINHSSHITVQNGVFGNNAVWGIFTSFSDDLLLQQNECFGSRRQHGIYVSNTCVRPTVRGNYLHDNYSCGLHMNGDLSQGGIGLISGGLIENNLIVNNGAGGGAAINMDGVQDSIVRNNLLINNHASGITCFRIDAASGPKGLQILNNTVDMAADSRWALSFSASAGRNLVRNNILLNRNPEHGGLRYTDAADSRNTDSDYNVLAKVTADDGNTVVTLSQWQNRGVEKHSLSASPARLFINPAKGDYRLSAGSPAIGAGQALPSVPTDKTGKVRPMHGACDIGCYESGGVAKR